MHLYNEVAAKYMNLCVIFLILLFVSQGAESKFSIIKVFSVIFTKLHSDFIFPIKKKKKEKKFALFNCVSML